MSTDVTAGEISSFSLPRGHTVRAPGWAVNGLAGSPDYPSDLIPAESPNAQAEAAGASPVRSSLLFGGSRGRPGLG
jgi:hypothetical protein